MKTVNSGIVRRMDDLGRIVIPKEMRKMANIKEGDPFEVGVANGCILLEKYTGEIDEETGKPIPPKQETPTPIPKKIKLYIDTYDRKAYKTIEEIASAMADNGDISSFEDWLCNNYNAQSFFNEIKELYNGDFVKASDELRKEYNDDIIGEVQDLLDNLRNNDYVEIEVEI